MGFAFNEKEERIKAVLFFFNLKSLLLRFFHYFVKNRD